MPKLPAINGRKLVELLVKVGFAIIVGKGSHVVVKHTDGRRTTVPIHGKEIPKGTLLAILRDLEISKDDLKDLLTK